MARHLDEIAARAGKEDTTVRAAAGAAALFHTLVRAPQPHMDAGT